MNVILIWLIGGIVLSLLDLLLGTVYLFALGTVCILTAGFSFFVSSHLWQFFFFGVTGISICWFLSFRKRRCPKGQSWTASQLNNINAGHLVYVSHWKDDGTTRVNYRGAVWDAKANSGERLEKGYWEITGQTGNVLNLRRKANV